MTRCLIHSSSTWVGSGATYTGDDPLGYVISLNLRRRHLDESQRGMVGGKIEEFRHGGGRQDANLHLDRAAAAELLNVSLRTIASAKRVLEHGQLELVMAVERGEVAVSAAADVATR